MAVSTTLNSRIFATPLPCSSDDQNIPLVKFQGEAPVLRPTILRTTRVVAVRLSLI